MCFGFTTNKKQKQQLERDGNQDRDQAQTMSNTTTPTNQAKAYSSSRPVVANFASEKIVTGAGVAIFHLASERVVVCYHSRDGYWFLPKGRRNEGEGSREAAVREGYEESGYRCRLLPLPIPHRQPPAEEDTKDDKSRNPFVIEPVWTQLVPQSATAQYILHWYIAETLPPDTSTLGDPSTASSRPIQSTRAYVTPPPPEHMTIVDRVRMDDIVVRNEKSVFEPVRQEGTGVDEEELLYEAYLLPIAEARRHLRGSIMEDVVRRGWEAIGLRKRIEAGG